MTVNIPLEWWVADFSLTQLVYQPPHVLDCEMVEEICNNDMTMSAAAKETTNKSVKAAAKTIMNSFLVWDRRFDTHNELNLSPILYIKNI